MGSQIIHKSTFFVVTVLGLVVSYVNCQNTVVVDAGVLGKIQGRQATTTGGKNIKFWSFLGIPYAEEDSYTGENRFQVSIQIEMVSKPILAKHTLKFIRFS